MKTNKREQGRRAVEAMLKYDLPIYEIREILAGMTSYQFANGAYERFIEEMHKPVEATNDNQ